MRRLLSVCGRSVTKTCHQIARYSSIAPKIELRDYQQQSIASVLEYLAKGERRLGLSLATGSGKTVVFSHLIEQVPCPSPEATRTLVLAHRRELVEQAARHCHNVYPEKIIEIEMGAQKASGTADITVASVASVGRRLEKYDPSTYKLMIVDEAHHITAASYTAVRDWFGLKDKAGHVALVGVSATFSRADGISLGSAIDHIVFHKDYLEMIDEDYLAGLVITTVQTGVDLNKVKVSRGEFAVGELSQAVNTPATNELTVRSWLAKAQGRHSTLVFGADIAHIKDLTDCFRKHGVDARYITGDTKIDIRSDTLQGFREGKFPVLLNCGIFTEGTDIPNIDCVLLARPTKSRNLLIQMIGRGLRKHDSKNNCHIIDMVGSLNTGIVTTPTLFGLDPDEALESADKTMIDAVQHEQKAKKQRETNHTSGPVVFTDYDDVLDFLKNNQGVAKLHSPHHWTEIDDTRFILSDVSGDYLTVAKINGVEEWHVMVTMKLFASKSPYMTPRLIAMAPDRKAALAAADTYAKRRFVRAYIDKWASWRRAPASNGQLAFLNKFRKGAELDSSSVTKGAAAEWITKLKHGVAGRFELAYNKAKTQAALAEKKASQSRIGRQGPVL